MLKLFKKKIKGFTLVETLVAIVIFLITIAAMGATLTGAMQANQKQKIYNLSQNLASSIMSTKVWNQPFDYLYEFSDCHTNSIQSDGAALLGGAAGTSPTTATCLPTTGYVSIPIPATNTSYPELAKLKN